MRRLLADMIRDALFLDGDGGSGGGSGGDGGGAGGSGAGGSGGEGGGSGEGGSGGSGSGSGGEGGQGGDGGEGGDDDDADDDDKPVSRREHRKRGKENQKLKEELKGFKDADTEFKKGLAKLLGIEPDDESPEALKKAMADAQKTVGEKDTTIAEQSKEITSLKVQIAVGDAARKEGADDGLTYAYLNAHGKLSNLDPEADDFDTKVSGLVQDAVKEKEVLKTRQVPGRSGSDLNGGGSSGDQAKSLEGAIAARYKS